MSVHQACTNSPSHHVATSWFHPTPSKYPNPLPPPITPRIDQHPKRKRIGLIRRNRRNIPPIRVYNLQHPHSSILQAHFHPPPIPRSFRLAPRTRYSDIQDPHFPYRLFVGFGNEPTALLALLLEELDNDGAVGGLGSVVAVLRRQGGGCCGIEGAEQGCGAGVDGALDAVFGHVGEGGVEDVVGGWGDGGEEAVEEDGV